VTGQLIGVGVGPGDPELLTLKAVRLLKTADVLAHFAKAGRPSHARASAEPFLPSNFIEAPLLYPVTTEQPLDSPEYRSAIDRFFDESAATLSAHLDAGRTVVVLSEGDPLFFGSYMHLHVRLQHRYPVQVVPGVTAMSAAWSAAGAAMVRGDHTLTVLPGTMAESEVAEHLERHESAVIMKIGRNLAKIRRALTTCGRLKDAVYVECVSMGEQKVVPLAEKEDDHAPYFSMILLPDAWEPS
jgi:precorrin-2/cobalt-factor-2 C20-methyltransferase